MFAVLGLIAVVVAAWSLLAQEQTDRFPFNPSQGSLSEIKTFSSPQEFKQYVKASSQPAQGGIFNQVGSAASDLAQPTVRGETALQATQMEETSGGAGDVKTVDRVSETNVQEEGIDEPDIVKTDGQTIYYSREHYYGQDQSKLIKAFPPTNLSEQATIGESGKMLLTEDEETLLVLSNDRLTGYNVSNPSQPQQQWEMELEGRFVSARMHQGQVYLVTRESLSSYDGCPIRPLTVSKGDSKKALEIPCNRIYHPAKPLPAELTYTALSFDPTTGKIKDSLSFTGFSRSPVVYMSSNALYITYSDRLDRQHIIVEYLLSDSNDSIPEKIVDRIEEVRSYNLSRRATSVEIDSILDDYSRSLSEDERLKFRTELRNGLRNYMKEHMRELERTGIAKISLGDNLDLAATGEVPGRPLNQFSLDEYEGHLRIATTVGRGDLSANDAYILNENLKVTGSVQDMGLTERIYSVRFIGDQGYVVTYRRIDPFHVLDLSDPSDPELTGELKLPGYSSYLHPLGEDRILGIGKEDRQVKMSVFDVSDPNNPVEETSRILDEHWSAISNSHHAFLLDKKHGVFFLPGSNGGYIFAYENGLDLKTAVSVDQAKRAVYINDYLYILSENQVTVLDENNWERVQELELDWPRRDHRPVKPMPEPDMK